MSRRADCERSDSYWETTQYLKRLKVKYPVSQDYQVLYMYFFFIWEMNHLLGVGRFDLSLQLLSFLVLHISCTWRSELFSEQSLRKVGAKVTFSPFGIPSVICNNTPLLSNCLKLFRSHVFFSATFLWNMSVHIWSVLKVCKCI